MHYATGRSSGPVLEEKSFIMANTEGFLCHTYNCKVTQTFCKARRKKDEMFCLSCNPNNLKTRMINKIVNRKNVPMRGNQNTYFRQVAMMLLPLNIGENTIVKICSEGIRKQQGTISCVGIELGRKYRTINLRNGEVFITRIK